MAGRKTGNGKISDAQKQKVAVAKLAGKTDAEAAKLAGISRTSVHYILKDPGTRNFAREIKFALIDKFVKVVDMALDSLAASYEKADNENSQAKLRQEALQFALFCEPNAYGASAQGPEAVTGPATAPTLGEILVRFNGSSSQGVQHSAPAHPVSNGATP